jgi:hypothetical protein
MSKSKTIRNLAAGVFLVLGWLAWTQTQAPELSLTKVKGVILAEDRDDKYHQDRNNVETLRNRVSTLISRHKSSVDCRQGNNRRVQPGSG